MSNFRKADKPTEGEIVDVNEQKAPVETPQEETPAQETVNEPDKPAERKKNLLVKSAEAVVAWDEKREAKKLQRAEEKKQKLEAKKAGKAEKAQQPTWKKALKVGGIVLGGAALIGGGLVLANNRDTDDQDDDDDYVPQLPGETIPDAEFEEIETEESSVTEIQPEAAEEVDE